MDEKVRKQRNLNPHKPALIAMILYNRSYANSVKGSMDFYNALTDGEKRTCRELAEWITAAPDFKP